MIEIELERLFLLKKIPDAIKGVPGKEICDIYIPASHLHPITRIRKKGEQYEMTKKVVNDNDRSERHEHTIKLTEDEYKTLSQVVGKRLEKTRYTFSYGNCTAEISVFGGELSGLVTADFEFKSIEEKNNFVMPDFCLVEATHETIFAGGMLCGKTYADIEPRLIELGYSKIIPS